MATTADYMEYVLDCIRPLFSYDISYKKMFGEYCIYIEGKPLILICDNQVFIKMLPCIEPYMHDASIGIPYEGAKERYILDIENRSLVQKVIPLLEQNTPFIIKKSNKKERTTKSQFYNLKEKLQSHIHKIDIENMATLITQEEGNRLKEELFALLFDEDKRISDNAAWVFTHIPLSHNEWFFTKRTPLIVEATHTKSATKQRLILTLLLQHPFEKDDIDTSLIDFCINAISSSAYSAGTKSVCMKLAYKQCRHFPEVKQELRIALEYLEPAYISTAERTTRRMLLQKISNQDAK